MPPQPKASPGQTLDGRFLLGEEIGHGGMSTIFKALDLQNPGETVVVKVRLPAFSSGVGACPCSNAKKRLAASSTIPSS